MDRRERIGSLNDMLIAAMQGWQTDIYTALPGIIGSFDSSKLICSVQPAIQAQIVNPNNGNKDWVDLPLLVDCPVFFPSGGGCTLTFPIAQGDECLVIFSSRCIDAWWQSGGIQNQPMLRMHDLSDGFVFAGVRSQPRKFNVSTSAAQLRTDDGNAYVEINSSNHNITAQTTGTVKAATNSADVTVSGTDVTINCNTGTATINSSTATVNASISATITSPIIKLQNSGAALKKLIKDTFVTLYNNHVHYVAGTGINTTTPLALSTTDTTSVVEAE